MWENVKLWDIFHIEDMGYFMRVTQEQANRHYQIEHGYELGGDSGNTYDEPAPEGQFYAVLLNRLYRARTFQIDSVLNGYEIQSINVLPKTKTLVLNRFDEAKKWAPMEPIELFIKLLETQGLPTTTDYTVWKDQFEGKQILAQVDHHESFEWMMWPPQVDPEARTLPMDLTLTAVYDEATSNRYREGHAGKAIMNLQFAQYGQRFQTENDMIWRLASPAEIALQFGEGVTEFDSEYGRTYYSFTDDMQNWQIFPIDIEGYKVRCTLEASPAPALPEVGPKPCFAALSVTAWTPVPDDLVVWQVRPKNFKLSSLNMGDKLTYCSTTYSVVSAEDYVNVGGSKPGYRSGSTVYCLADTERHSSGTQMFRPHSMMLTPGDEGSIDRIGKLANDLVLPYAKRLMRADTLPFGTQSNHLAVVPEKFSYQKLLPGDIVRTAHAQYMIADNALWKHCFPTQTFAMPSNFVGVRKEGDMHSYINFAETNGDEIFRITHMTRMTRNLTDVVKMRANETLRKVVEQLNRMQSESPTDVLARIKELVE